MTSMLRQWNNFPGVVLIDFEDRRHEFHSPKKCSIDKKDSNVRGTDVWFTDLVRAKSFDDDQTTLKVSRSFVNSLDSNNCSVRRWYWRKGITLHSLFSLFLSSIQKHWMNLLHTLLEDKFSVSVILNQRIFIGICIRQGMHRVSRVDLLYDPFEHKINVTDSFVKRTKKFSSTDVLLFLRSTFNFLERSGRHIFVVVFETRGQNKTVE